MDVSKLEDIRYRIGNLRYEINCLKESPGISQQEVGYREGRRFSMESELHFLEGLVKHDGQDIHI